MVVTDGSTRRIFDTYVMVVDEAFDSSIGSTRLPNDPESAGALGSQAQ